MEIELYAKLQNPIEAIDRIGEFFAKSGMFGCDRSEQGKVLAMICLSEKKSPVEITRTYDIVDGKLRKKALAALAEFRAAGGKHKWIKTGDEPVAFDAKEAVGEFTFEGQSQTVRFSIADAKLQGLIRDKSNWVKTPGNMLRARCASNAIAMLAPEIFAGEGSEETESTPPILNISAAPTPTPAQSHVIDVPSEVKQPTGPAAPPQQVSKPVESQSAPAAPVQQTAQPSGQLSADIVAKLEQSIGEHAVAAGTWMLKQGWLKPGEGLSALTPTRAERIIKQRDSFIRAIQGAK